METKLTIALENQGLVENDDVTLHCQNCGATSTGNSALSLLDQIVRSHTELSTVLRWAGRQISRFEDPDHQALEKIRETLKRADNIRRTLRVPADFAQDKKQVKYPLAADATVVGPTEVCPAMHGEAVQQAMPKRTRLTRPRSLQILKFPANLGVPQS
jgi:hypothetical protein